MWLCPKDKSLLEESDHGLFCPQCRTEYTRHHSAIDFGEKADRVNPKQKLIEQLLRLDRTGSFSEAIGTFTDHNGFARMQNSSEWKYLFPVVPNAAVLELGAGVGSDTLSLAAEHSEVVSAVPTVLNAALLERRLTEQDVSNVRVAVLPDLVNLPWADQSFGGIALEDAAAAGFSFTTDTLEAFSRECRRLLKPGGCVCMGVGNVLHTTGLLPALKSKLQASHHPESLNREVKREGFPPRKALKLRDITRAMTVAGFSTPTCFAPLPDEKQSKAVLPLDSRPALHYYFDNLVRRDGVVIRVASLLMKAAIATGAARLLFPYTIAVFTLPSMSDAVESK